MTKVEEEKTYRVKLTEENTYQVERSQELDDVKIFVAKGEKGDKGDKGDKGERGESGTTDYREMLNKPQINNVELTGDKSFEDLGAETLSNIDIDNLINSIV